MDGRLVRVRARVLVGWEGDNFLGLDAAFGKIHAGPVFTFIGYFHFVPNEKSRRKSVFDPGPPQFSANSVSLPELTKTP
jgi:hypothetical protein